MAEGLISIQGNKGLWIILDHLGQVGNRDKATLSDPFCFREGTIGNTDIFIL
jgi:hypothetical protein